MTIESATEAAKPAARRRVSGGAWIGIAVIGIWTTLALLAPWIAPYGVGEFISNTPLAPPGGKATLGTDYMGRDILSRLIWGARTTLGMGLLATIISHAVGVPLGLLSALRGGWVDTVISRANDALLSIPHVMMGLVIIAALGSSIPILVVSTGLMYASAVYRISRALVLDQRVKEYVEVAQVRGEGTAWILFREILPNMRAPLLTDFAIRMAFIVLFMSSISFLGLGVQPPNADWGSMVRENMEGLARGSLAAIIPAAALASITISLSLIMDEIALRTGKAPGGPRE